MKENYMTTGCRPSVFVSSTCYDLAPIRHDLHCFIESLGMNPIMSEFNSFPIVPDLDTVANCLKVVKEQADIFVLIIGGRYGQKTEAGKSVTNLEYLEAKAKGIPRYVFIRKEILSAVAIWQKNPSQDFLGIVDSPDIFKFVQSLLDPKENWVFSFESSQEIKGILLKQLAYLFKDALDIRTKVIRTGDPGILQDISGIALTLAIQKPFAWEYRFFSQLISDEVGRLSFLKKDLDYGIFIGSGIYLNDLDAFVDWIRKKMGEISSFVGALDKIINTGFPEAIGPPGVSGDVAKIIYVAQRFGDVYRRLLEWSIEFGQVQAEDNFKSVLNIVARASKNVIVEIEDFSQTLQQQINLAISQYERTKEPQSFTVCLRLTCPDMADLSVELHRLTDRH